MTGWRGFRSGLIAFACCAAGAVTVSFFLAIFGFILFKGLPGLSWNFLSSPMKEAGLSGGVLYQMAGTGLLIATALAVCVPLALAAAIASNGYLTGPARRVFLLFLQLFHGAPSVLFGIFGYFLFAKFLGWGKSWLAGGIILGMMILPTVALACYEGMKRVPREYIENGKALGLGPAALVWSLWVPQSLSSLASGLLLGLGRAAGETAPVMFTAAVFSGATLPRGVADSPVVCLSYHIFNLAQEAYQAQALRQAWGAALVLTLITIGLSFAALPFRLRFHEEARS
jgi:phosphate transport system permease protein